MEESLKKSIAWKPTLATSSNDSYRRADLCLMVAMITININLAKPVDDDDDDDGEVSKPLSFSCSGVCI